MKQRDCRRFQSALRETEGPDFEFAARHAETCPDCSALRNDWLAIARSARELHRDWESPDLWPRIHRALAEEAQSGTPRQGIRWTWRFGVVTQAWAALALLLVFASAVWILRREAQPPEPPEAIVERERKLLTEQALREIETSEQAYIRSIEKLSQLAEPKIQNPTTSLLLSYREKLMLIDAAIEECRLNIERNQFNAHLRKELMSIYQEKQKTLLEITDGVRNANQ